MLAPDYEFDIFNSLKYFKVKGIKPDSVAYKKGLRNEQDIKSFIKYPKNDQIYLEIASDINKTKKFNIYPIYKIIKLPQYVSNLF